MSNSPFEIFRRNLKPMMVLLTLLALFAFVVLPALDTYLRQGGGANTDPVLASYDGVELTATRVAKGTQTHRAVVSFLSDLAQETLKRGGVPQTQGFQYDQQTKQIQSLGIDANPSEESTIAAMRFYSEARKAGFELDDTSIENWLARFTDGTMSDTEMMQVLGRSTNNQLGQLAMYEQLRMHLLAELYQRSAFAGLAMGQFPVLTPLGQWENFLKINQQASVDAYGILVAEFIDQTDPEPSKKEIERVFEEGRELIAYPNDQDPKPKFRRPDSAQFEYLAADLKAFVDREKAKLTEDQLRAEYERRLAGGDFRLPVEQTKDLLEAMEAQPEKPADADTPAETDMPTESATPADPKPAAETETPDAPEKSPTPTEPEVKAEPAEPADVEGEAAETSGDGAAINADANGVRLVLLQEEEKQADAPEESKPAATPEKPAASEPETATTEPQSTSTEPAAAVEPAMVPETAASSETDGVADDSAPTDATEPSDDPLDLGDAPEPTKPQSFEEVREQIAEELASTPARNQLDKTITEVNKVMRAYFTNRAIHESNVMVGVATEKDAPVQPNLKELAEKLGIRHGTTDLVNRVSVEQLPVGESFGLGSAMNQRGAPFGALMFGAQLRGGGEIVGPPEFSPLRSVDLENQISYVTWKTKNIESFTPTLEEARDEVILAIRTAEARQLARTAAEKLAAEATKKSLADIVPEDKKANYQTGLGPFSWLDQVGPGQFVPGNVPELDAVGEDFMRAAFTTEVDSYSVAPNAPQTVFYVIMPTKFQPEMETLREQFRQPFPRIMALMSGGGTANNLVRGFYESVDQRTKFEMNLTGDQP